MFNWVKRIFRKKRLGQETPSEKVYVSPQLKKKYSQDWSDIEGADDPQVIQLVHLYSENASQGRIKRRGSGITFKELE